MDISKISRPQQQLQVEANIYTINSGIERRSSGQETPIAKYGTLLPIHGSHLFGKSDKAFNTLPCVKDGRDDRMQPGHRNSSLSKRRLPGSVICAGTPVHHASSHRRRVLVRCDLKSARGPSPPTASNGALGLVDRRDLYRPDKYGREEPRGQADVRHLRERFQGSHLAGGIRCRHQCCFPISPEAKGNEEGGNRCGLRYPWREADQGKGACREE
jgi:hypothetical protein